MKSIKRQKDQQALLNHGDNDRWTKYRQEEFGKNGTHWLRLGLINLLIILIMPPYVLKQKKPACAGFYMEKPEYRSYSGKSFKAYLGSLNVQTVPPWFRCLTRLATSPPHRGTAPPQPDTTDRNCSPSCSQVTGDPTMPEPVLNL